MTINIKCPVCRASNESSKFNLSCRRCGTDLTMPCKITAYSYKYRLMFTKELLQGSINPELLKKAMELKHSV
jgi:hypothetical protein